MPNTPDAPEDSATVIMAIDELFAAARITTLRKPDGNALRIWPAVCQTSSTLLGRKRKRKRKSAENTAESGPRNTGKPTRRMLDKPIRVHEQLTAAQETQLRRLSRRRYLTARVACTMNRKTLVTTCYGASRTYKDISVETRASDCPI